MIFQKLTNKSDIFTSIFVNNDGGITGFDDNDSLYCRSFGEHTVSILIDDHLALPNFETFVSGLQFREHLPRVPAAAIAIFVINITNGDDACLNTRFLNGLKESVKKAKPGTEIYTCQILLSLGAKIDPGLVEGQQIIELYYKSTYPSPALSRLMEYVRRVMGADLPGSEFPNYTFDELQKIAAHINRENFNFKKPRADAIPKYEIINSRPAILQ